MTITVEQYRTLVRQVPCPLDICSAAEGEKCFALHTDHDPRENPSTWTWSTGKRVDYVHDDRSCAYHELTMDALNAWFGNK